MLAAIGAGEPDLVISLLMAFEGEAAKAFAALPCTRCVLPQRCECCCKPIDLVLLRSAHSRNICRLAARLGRLAATAAHRPDSGCPPYLHSCELTDSSGTLERMIVQRRSPDITAIVVHSTASFAKAHRRSQGKPRRANLCRIDSSNLGHHEGWEGARGRWQEMKAV